MIGKPKVQILIRCGILPNLILVCTVCICPIKRMLGFNERIFDAVIIFVFVCLLLVDGCFCDALFLAQLSHSDKVSLCDRSLSIVRHCPLSVP